MGAGQGTSQLNHGDSEKHGLEHSDEGEGEEPHPPSLRITSYPSASAAGLRPPTRRWRSGCGSKGDKPE